MKLKKLLIIIGILSIVVLFIHFFSKNAALVETYYSMGVYPYIATSLRYLFTFLPFSFGDILYGLVICYLLWKLTTGVSALLRKKVTKQVLLFFSLRSVIKLLLIYIIFNALWGINYNRLGIATQLELKLEKYSLNDVKQLNQILLEKANASKVQLLTHPPSTLHTNQIFEKAVVAYQNLNNKYSFINYQPVSLKSSLWGWLGNYLGFLGYYNPFSGEAQVNTTVPTFIQPYTTCHEIAHQLGYAKENEANFVGYLAASSSKDEDFQYSVYLDLFLYAQRNLYRADSAAARSYAVQLLPDIKNDLKIWRQFNAAHKNLAEPVVRWLYGKYLENNQQPSGVLSYDEVAGFLIAYYKKYGKL